MAAVFCTTAKPEQGSSAKTGEQSGAGYAILDLWLKVLI